jgi:Protein of unknown function (DUF4013)
MEYMRSLQFILERKNWITNILIGGVCLLVPIIGPIVFSGYLFEVIDALRSDPEHKEYPDFDFNKLMDYIMRGVWPFLMQLVLGLIVGVPLAIVGGCCGGIAGAIAAQANSQAIVLVFQFFFFVLILIVGITSALISFPAELQAGLGREFNFPRMIAFVKEFNKLVFKELLLSLLFIVAIAIVAEFVGLAMLCVGIYFTIAAVVMAQFHLKFQLYQLYLERGGTPVVRMGGASHAAEPLRGQPRYPDSDEGIRGER